MVTKRSQVFNYGEDKRSKDASERYDTVFGEDESGVAREQIDRLGCKQKVNGTSDTLARCEMLA
jgi:hypothetical protein